MTSSLLLRLQNIWPFSLSKPDDLKTSNGLVRGLKIPEHTKKFVFALREPQSNSVVYILATQNLSEQSSLDAESLIKEVKPDAIVAQVSNSTMDDILSEEINLREDQSRMVPMSYFGVLKGCFKEKLNKVEYENMAGCQVLEQIFGVGFYGHFLAAKKASMEVKSPLFLLDSPSRSCALDHHNEGDSGASSVQGKATQASSSLLQSNGFNPGKLVVQSGDVSKILCKRICLTDKFELTAVKSLASSLDFSISKLDAVPKRSQANCDSNLDFEVPSYAQSFYLLLTDLQNIFIDLPIIGKAMVHAQKVLVNVDRGEKVDPEVLCEARKLKIAVEGLRIALNDVARSPLCKNGKDSGNIAFSDLPYEEKRHILFAQALKSQARKYGSLVAIVDVSSLAGIRRHWDNPVPPEISDLASECFTLFEDNGEAALGYLTDRKRLLTDKPVIAVGAGATAILGVTALPKALPLSSFFKLITYKVPVTVKMGLTHAPRAIAALGKFFGTPKLFAPLKATVSGLAGSGTNMSTMKVAASAEKIRAVAHGVIASAERTSFSAMRTAFYGIMKSYRGQPVGVTPWAAFGFSVAACSGLLMFGDGIECAAEAVPAAATIACLGRGLRSLHEASEAVKHSDSSKLQEIIHNALYNMKIKRIQ
ncbi:hypothetical protein EJ110_NYTH51131 [Nymphaea thermarum]|nr:hypothetical protein EJ110_NYTH51131 [Nymphaea thermarum]